MRIAIFSQTLLLVIAVASASACQRAQMEPHERRIIAGGLEELSIENDYLIDPLIVIEQCWIQAPEEAREGIQCWHGRNTQLSCRELRAIEQFSRDLSDYFFEMRSLHHASSYGFSVTDVILGDERSFQGHLFHRGSLAIEMRWEGEGFQLFGDSFPHPESVVIKQRLRDQWLAMYHVDLNEHEIRSRADLADFLRCSLEP